jgi:HEAT repeat protein
MFARPQRPLIVAAAGVFILVATYLYSWRGPSCSALLHQITGASAFSDRMKALFLIGEGKACGDAAVTALISLVDSEKEDEYIKSAAVIALGKMKATRASVSIQRRLDLLKIRDATSAGPSQHQLAAETALKRLNSS